jgi:hypothetical protein
MGFTAIQKGRVWHKTGGRCWYCGTQTIPFPTEHYLLRGDCFSVDHFIAESRGGGEEIENLVPCCFKCNSKKQDLTLEGFRQVCLSPKNNEEGFEPLQWVPWQLGIGEIHEPDDSNTRFYFELLAELFPAPVYSGSDDETF